MISVLFLCSLAMVVYDWRERRLPNRLNTLFFLAALPTVPLHRLCLQMGLAALVYWFFALFSQLLKQTTRQVFGMGDVKLLAGIAVWQGQRVTVILTLAFMLAFVPALVLLLRRWRGHAVPENLPFAVFLLAAAWWIWWFGSAHWFVIL